MAEAASVIPATTAALSKGSGCWTSECNAEVVPMLYPVWLWSRG